MSGRTVSPGWRRWLEENPDERARWELEDVLLELLSDPEIRKHDNAWISETLAEAVVETGWKAPAPTNPLPEAHP